METADRADGTMGRQPSRAFLTLVVALLGLLAIAQLVPFGGMTLAQWLAVDTCLDGGGAWDYDLDRCDTADAMQ